MPAETKAKQAKKGNGKVFKGLIPTLLVSTAIIVVVGLLGRKAGEE